MPPRDFESAPVSDQLGLPAVISGLVADLAELRAGKISVNDAIARSLLAKQIFNGVRIYLNGTKLLADNARAISVHRDSGSGPQGENSRSEVEGEAPQSGGEAASPNPSGETPNAS